MIAKKSLVDNLMIALAIAVSLLLLPLLSCGIKGICAHSAAPRYAILIDIDDNTLYLLKNSKQFKIYSCASGAPQTPSPLGTFTIIQKSHWGEGFGGYYMGLNCPWGTYGIHGTLFPDSVGQASSHGCFRMYNWDVAELYDYVKVGTTVLVVSGNYGLFGEGMRTLTPGMYGQDVLAVQRRLKELGYYRGDVNGIFETTGFLSAIHKFQKAAKLPVRDSVNKKMYAALGFVLME